MARGAEMTGALGGCGAAGLTAASCVVQQVTQIAWSFAGVQGAELLVLRHEVAVLRRT